MRAAARRPASDPRWRAGCITLVRARPARVSVADCGNRIPRAQLCRFASEAELATLHGHLSEM